MLLWEVVLTWDRAANSISANFVLQAEYVTRDLAELSRNFTHCRSSKLTRRSPKCVASE
jgi:hypothetical protein